MFVSVKLIYFLNSICLTNRQVYDEFGLSSLYTDEVNLIFPVT